MLYVKNTGGKRFCVQLCGDVCGCQSGCAALFLAGDGKLPLPLPAVRRSLCFNLYGKPV